jgi:type VI secretion system protein
MVRRGLLSRIAGGDAAPVEEVESILAHLNALLNARQNESPCVPQYGIVDLSDIVYAFPAAVSQLVKSIRETIAEFEPRLKNVTVPQQQDDNPLVLRFEIVAQLALRARSSGTLRFATTVLPGGRIEVAR